jgi:hypothetical protein
MNSVSAGTRTEILENIEAARHEFQFQLEQVSARTVHGRGTEYRVALKFDGTATWEVFSPQFETVAKHNGWTRQEKSTHLITALQGRATDVLHGIPIGVTFEQTTQDRL